MNQKKSGETAVSIDHIIFFIKNMNFVTQIIVSTHQTTE